MDPALATVLGVVIGSAITVFGNWLNNRQLKKQQEVQWKREDSKANKEANEQRQIRLEKEKAEEKKFLSEVYANSVLHLAVLSATYKIWREESYPNETFTRSMEELKEAQKHLTLIALHHYDKSNKEYKDFMNLHSSFNNTADFSNAYALRKLVLEFAENDPRLK